MSAVSERLATAPRFPVRAVVVAALVLLALVVGLVLYAGSRKSAVPLPFGPAANGAIAFVDQDGAIRSGRADATAFNVIVPGPGNERPVFSPDGTKLAYLHIQHHRRLVVRRKRGAHPQSRQLSSRRRISAGRPTAARSSSDPSRAGSLAFDAAKPGPPTLITDKARLSGSVSGLSDAIRASQACSARRSATRSRSSVPGRRGMGSTSRGATVPASGRCSQPRPVTFRSSTWGAPSGRPMAAGSRS